MVEKRSDLLPTHETRSISKRCERRGPTNQSLPLSPFASSPSRSFLLLSQSELSSHTHTPTVSKAGVAVAVGRFQFQFQFQIRFPVCCSVRTGRPSSQSVPPTPCGMCLYHPTKHHPPSSRQPQTLLRCVATPSVSLPRPSSKLNAMTAGPPSPSVPVKDTTAGVRSSRHHHPRQASAVSKAHAASGNHHPRIIVQHNYHDHSQEPPPPPAVVTTTTDLESSGSASFPSSAASNSISSNNSSAFPVRLHSMLTHAAEDGIAHIVSFAPHGRAVQIHDPEAFKRLLPRYFTLSKIASFQRQLNLYGFSRLTRGADRGCYYHELFLRGMPWLMSRMTRVKVKGTGVRARSNPEQEPDLYALPWVGITPGGAVVSTSDADEGSERTVCGPENTSTTTSVVPTPTVLSITRLFAMETTAIVVSPSSSLPRSTVVAPQSMSSVVSQTTASSSSSGSRHRSTSSSTSSSCSSSSSSDDFEMEDADMDKDDNDGDLVLSGWGMPFHYLGKIDAAAPAVEWLPAASNVTGVDAGIPGRPLKHPGTLQLHMPLPPAAPGVARVDVDRELEQALHVLLEEEDDDDNGCGLYDTLPF